jgi:hypothetical protein
LYRNFLHKFYKNLSGKELSEVWPWEQKSPDIHCSLRVHIACFSLDDFFLPPGTTLAGRLLILIYNGSEHSYPITAMEAGHKAGHFVLYAPGAITPGLRDAIMMWHTVKAIIRHVTIVFVIIFPM